MSRRSEARGLHVDLDRLRYQNEYFFGPCGVPRKALYVGVGHGHDAVLALLDGRLDEVVGVDPYDEEGGNSSQDHRVLTDLVDEYRLNDRFEIRTQTVDEYLDTKPETGFDAVVMADVLHHIFETREPLEATEDRTRAEQLFRRLRRVTTPGGMLVVSDVQRHGLRPWLSRRGIAWTSVDYRTKQDWPEWAKAAQAGGWNRHSVRFYVPYALRALGKLIQTRLVHPIVCNRYVLHFENPGPR